MPASTLPQQDTINQYLGDGSETVYTYSYLIPEEEDIAVYVTPAGQTANPSADIKILNTDYTVQDVGTLEGGTVTFTIAPGISDIVTLIRNVQASISTQFADSRNFNGQNLDDAFEREMLVIQQNKTFNEQRALHYAVNSYLPDTVDQVDLPLLDQERAIWMRRNGVIDAVVLEENPDVSTLRSELLNNTEGGDGASIIGYYDTYDDAPSNVSDFLNNNLPSVIGRLNREYFGIASGTQNHIVLTVNSDMTEYQIGDVVYFKNLIANSGACDVNINDIGVATLYITDPTTGGYQNTPNCSLLTGGHYTISYDGTNWILQNPFISTLFNTRSVVASVYLATNYSVPSDTVTLIPYNSTPNSDLKTFDPYSMWSGSPNYRFTVPFNGFYRVSTVIYIDGNTSTPSTGTFIKTLNAWALVNG